MRHPPPGGTVSIVIPCFNEHPNLQSGILVREVKRALKDGCAANPEVVFVDDGSSDGTLPFLRDLSQEDASIRYRSFSRNFGKEAAIYAGLEVASGDIVAVMDADLQDPPGMLPKLIDAVSSGRCDIAHARRTTREGEPLIRSWLARMFYKIMAYLTSVDIADGARDYVVMNRKVVDAILQVGEYNRFFKGIVGWVGFRSEWFEYVNVERASGESKWSTLSLASYAINGITAFSSAPLMLASALGVGSSIIAIVLMFAIGVRTLVFGDPVAGWPSLACLILLMGGGQFLCMGILGQYIAKTYIETKRRPLYLIQEESFLGGHPCS